MHFICSFDLLPEENTTLEEVWVVQSASDFHWCSTLSTWRLKPPYVFSDRGCFVQRQSSGVVTAAASKDVLSKLFSVDNKAFPKALWNTPWYWRMDLSWILQCFQGQWWMSLKVDGSFVFVSVSHVVCLHDIICCYKTNIYFVVTSLY